MQKSSSRGNIFILALICLIVIGSVSLDTVFSYFSDKTGTEGNTTMGYIELVSLTNLDGSEIGKAQTLDSDQTFTGEYKLITNTNINYYVYIFLKGTITPDGDKTHDSSCSDYYADDTDCLDITVNGYSKLDIKADGYTIYYKLCTIQTAGQNTQTFSISASIKTDLVENGCDYYDNATILFDMKVKTKQADYLQANEYTLGFSSPLINKDLCSIEFAEPVPNVSAYPELTFTIVDSTSKTISIAPTDTSITEVHIPHQVEMNGEIYTITSIPEGAFHGCTNLTTVTISEGVTSLEGFSFVDCTSLTTVTLPNSLTSIGTMSFGGCSSLTEIYIPDSVTYIGQMSFAECTNLSTVNIPEGVEYIPSNTFYGCTSLISITIPSSVNAIYSNAFAGCTNLTNVTMLSTYYISIETDSFSDCPNLQYNIYDNAKYWGNEDNPYLVLMGATSTSISSCEIHPNCEFITGEGFKDCTNLTSITIPDSVIIIGEEAFRGCTNLSSAVIGDSVKSIVGHTFQDCTSLTSITIPSSVTYIGSYAFDNCTNLTSVTFENTEGWHLDSTTGTSIDVTNPSTNATNLKSSSGASWYFKSLYRV